LAPINGEELRKCQLLVRGEEGSTPCVGTVTAGIISYDGVTGSDVAPEAYLCDRDAGLRSGRERHHATRPNHQTERPAATATSTAPRAANNALISVSRFSTTSRVLRPW